jgi:hypothetical protein
VLLVGCKLRVKVFKLRDGWQAVIPAVYHFPAFGNILFHGGVVGGFGGGHAAVFFQCLCCNLFHFGEVIVQFQIRDKLMQEHFPLCLVCFQCFLSLMA